MMKRLLVLALALAAATGLRAQLLTWTPPFPREADPAQTLVVTVDASKGNQGLFNFANTSDVYVHIGAITSLSSSASDWRYVPFTWATTPAAAKASYLGNNKWSFTITGSLRTFFNITNATETLKAIAILFRSGNGNNVQRNTDGSDMYVPVYDNSLAVRIDNPPSQPKFIRVPEPQSWTIGTAVSVTANASQAATLKLFHNGTQIATAANATTITGSSTVTAAGNQQLIAEATVGTTVKSDTFNVFVAPAGGSPTAALPAGVRDGINYEPGDTSVTLVLRAPGKNVVTVIGEFNNWTPGTADVLNKTPDGRFFWIRVKGLVAGREYAYQYVVDNAIKISDPYTEKILDPANDQYISAATYPNLKPYPAGQTGLVSVLQTAAPAYSWGGGSFARPDKRGLVVYELLVRDFVGAHNWKTVQDSLPYLKKLGINAIELMPFNEFEGNESWGYNPTHYFAPDKYYGTKNSLKQFIDSCHKNGIAVIMDIVLNHTYGPSPLSRLYYDAANSRPATNNPWYNAVAPHAFGFGEDFNHESPDTKYFFTRVLQHWVSEYRIDGYRFDFSKGLTQKVSTNDGQFSAYDLSRINIIKQYADSIRVLDPTNYLILEHFADNTEEKELSDKDILLWGNLNSAYSQAAKGNPAGWDFSWGVHTVRGWTKPHLVTYMESHDEERVVYRTQNEGSAAGSYNTRDTATSLKRMELDAAFFLTLPGPKMIWQFGELGYPYSINTCPDGTVNNNCRLANKPIRWDYLNDARRKSVYNVYSALNALRMLPAYRNAFLSGNVDQNFSGAVKWLKLSSADTSHLVVVGNFDVTAQSGTVSFQTPGTWFDYFNNTTFSATGSAQSITLQPGEFRVYLNRNVNNIPVTAVVNIPAAANGLEARVYPNPAAGRFTVELGIPAISRATLDLYTATGQHAAALGSRQLGRGVHTLSFNRDGLPAGLYFLKVQTGNATKTISVTIQ